MWFFFCLIVFAFLVFPIGGVILSNIVYLPRVAKYVPYAIVFFALHNACYYFGYSIRGDYFDYITLSLEPPFLTLVLILWRDIRITWFTKLLSVVGYLLAAICVVIGVFWIFTFSLASASLVCNQKSTYNNAGESFEIRRYTLGDIVDSDRSYRFETYRTFKYLPLEQFISEQ